jgi:ABC-type uncharacterized transport system substrate-binding protein
VRRREFITLLGGAAAAWPLAARAQQRRLARIGALVLTIADAESLGRALREVLRELGYIEGQNFTLEFRSADGNADRLPDLAAELVRLPVDLIVATFTPCALAAKQATTTIPIVIAAVADPVGSGLVQSLARPGGNITGFSNMAAETAGKSVELLREMLPSLRPDLAVKYRLPSASVLRQFAQAGGLMSYGADVPDIFRRSAVLTHRILQGTKPSDLPVELPTKFELVINLKTAKALGLDVPWFLQQRADEVIE